MTQKILDITNERCPMAFVRARLFLDQCKDKSSAIIRYQRMPENRTLEQSITTLGHHIAARETEIIGRREIIILFIDVLIKN